MVNRLSNSYAGNRPFEFTVTPLVNVPLGRIKSRSLNTELLTADQLAVYYASYRHLAKIASRDGFRDSHGNIFARLGTGAIISGGGYLMMKFVESMAKKKGVDIEKVKRWGMDQKKEIRSLAAMSGA